LDLIILEVFSNLNDSMHYCTCSSLCKTWKLFSSSVCAVLILVSSALSVVVCSCQKARSSLIVARLLWGGEQGPRGGLGPMAWGTLPGCPERHPQAFASLAWGRAARLCPVRGADGRSERRHGFARHPSPQLPRGLGKLVVFGIGTIDCSENTGLD